MVKPFVFQIVGYQNSGKTSYTNKLLSQLSLEGYKTATIKHHGHGGKPNIVEKTDSARHITAGATASLVEGGGRMLLQAENISWTLAEKIDLLAAVNPDIILIEGHKYEIYPKLVLLRGSNDFQLLDKLKNIMAVLYQETEPEKVKESIPLFHRDDPKSVKWIIDFIESQVTKR